jgi:alpha-galactosidase
MKYLADYIHAKGMKIGIYSSAGKTTCAGYPASFGREQIDAIHYAEWGIDYLKYDGCGEKEGVDDITLYRRMRDALKGTGRPILYNICRFYAGDSHLWGDTVGNMWRTGGDIVTYIGQNPAVTWKNWFDVLTGQLLGKERFAGPGHWNDPDNVIVGYPRNNLQSMAEQRSQFSIWAIEAAPLILACDVRKVGPDIKTILLNRDVIAVNQDSLGRAGSRVRFDQTGGRKVHIFVKQMKDSSRAVVLFNENQSTSAATLTWKDLGWSAGAVADVRDLWKHEAMGPAKDSITVSVAGHDAIMLRLTPTPRTAARWSARATTGAAATRVRVAVSLRDGVTIVRSRPVAGGTGTAQMQFDPHGRLQRR